MNVALVTYLYGNALKSCEYIKSSSVYLRTSQLNFVESTFLSRFRASPMVFRRHHYSISVKETPYKNLDCYRRTLRNLSRRLLCSEEDPRESFITLSEETSKICGGDFQNFRRRLPTFREASSGFSETASKVFGGDFQSFRIRLPKFSKTTSKNFGANYQRRRPTFSETPKGGCVVSEEHPERKLSKEIPSRLLNRGSIPPMSRFTELGGFRFPRQAGADVETAWHLPKSFNRLGKWLSIKNSWHKIGSGA